MTQITLHIHNAQPCADSRDLAAALGNQHENVLALIADYEGEFKALGFLRFQTGEIIGRGRPPRYALLGEDQCYFLLTLVRNTDLVVKLKLGLVQAFRAARETGPVAALPTDPLELLALSLQGLQQHRTQIHALEQANIKLERRLDDTPIRMHPTLEARVKAGCQALSRVHPRSFAGAYHSFKEAFGVQGAPLARYDSLPAYRYQEALDWLDLQTRTFSAQRPLLESHTA